MLEPLREQRFRRLFVGRTIALFGNAVAPIALSFAVVYLGGTPFELGVVLASGLVPQLLFLLVGGVVGDRFPRHRVMVCSDVAAGIAQAAAAALLLTGAAHVWELIVLSAVNGAAAAFFFPASQGLVPQLVAPAGLHRANALLGFTRNATMVLGTALAGALVAGVGPGWVLAIDAVTGLVGATFVARLVVDGPRRRARSRFFPELADGWREVRARRWLWSVILQFGVINAFALGPVIVLGPFIAQRSLGGAAAWGLIMSAQALGLLVGGLAVMKIEPRRPLLVASIAVLSLAAPPLTLALALPAPVVAASAFAAGAALEIHAVLWFSTLQHEIAGEKLARVMSFEMLGSMILAPVAGLTIGPVAAAIGQETLLWVGVAMAAAATGCVLAIPEIRRLRSRGAPPTHEAPVPARIAA